MPPRFHFHLFASPERSSAKNSEHQLAGREHCRQVAQALADAGDQLTCYEQSQPTPRMVADAFQAADGVAVDGVAVDGVAVDGVAVDGVAVDGVAVDGVAVDGVAVDGVAVDGVAVDGVAVDGVAVDGVAVDGVAVDGVAVCWLRDWRPEVRLSHVKEQGDRFSGIEVLIDRPGQIAPVAAGMPLIIDLFHLMPLVAASLGNSLLDWGTLMVSAPAVKTLNAISCATWPEQIDPLLQTLLSTQQPIAWTLMPLDSDSDNAAGGPVSAGHALNELCPRSQPAHPRQLADRARDVMKQLSRFSAASADLTAIEAGLLQWHDLLTESHEVSQSIEGAGRNRCGDYWHAIMHRREGDFGNAKYWFRQVGTHLIQGQLAQMVSSLGATEGDDVRSLSERLTAGQRWNASAFVDACAAAVRNPGSPSESFLKEVQMLEMLLLLRQTCEDAAA